MSDGTTRPTSPKPTVRLIGADAGVFALVGAVRRALKNAGQIDRAKEFVARAYHAQDHEEVRSIACEYVEFR
jgi:hypothetical protein